MELSIIIPVYNERGTILKVLNTVKNVDIGDIEKEIIVVDDGSTDGTKDLLKEIKDNDIKIFYHGKNAGKGTALRTGFKYASGDLIIIQDADLEYNPNDYVNLLKPILSKETRVVYGSRFLEANHKEIPLHYIGNKLLTLITNSLYFSKITDMETCYKVFTRDVIKKINLKAKKFDFEPEITAKILKNGYNIIEVPIEYNSRGFSQGKKITWIDGLKAIYYLIKYRFVN